MTADKLKKLIDTAAGRRKADLVLKNGTIIDVYSGKLIKGDVAVCDGLIAGIGSYEGEEERDESGKFISPGLIDSHIHIESSYMTPEEFGKISVPHGTTTIIADPHEIVNVCGITGLKYMIEASKNTALDIKYMVPSCVPATPFENAGAVLGADEIKKIFKEDDVLGLGEFMNAVGVVNCDDECLEKILAAASEGRVIDGHSPGLGGNMLNAYISAGISTDHECSTAEEMHERISRGMYVLLRQGSACHDLRRLVSEVTHENSRRCLLCSDDRQVKTIFDTGHMESLVDICVQNGVWIVDAIRMASLNAAECFGLKDRGGIAPGKRADIVVFEDLKNFSCDEVFIEGKPVARKGKYLPEVVRCDASSVSSTFNVKDFRADKLKLKLKNGHVKVIGIIPGGVVTGCKSAEVKLTADGDFLYEEDKDIVKIAVVERHRGTGNVAVGLLSGYGIKNGAAAISVAHDSHNIIVAGTSDRDMAAAVNEIIAMKGGMVLLREGKIEYSIPLPIAGIMSDMKAEELDRKLIKIHDMAYTKFGINKKTEPFMTLCFMALPVIPELKITDKGLFDVTGFSFTDTQI